MSRPQPIAEIDHPLLDWLESIGQNIPWMAEQVGMHRSMLYRLVRGERTVSMKKALVISQFSGISIEDLLPKTTDDERRALRR